MDTDLDWLDAESWNSELSERCTWLRENNPVHWSEKTGLWVLTRFADVEYVSKHNKLFCSGPGVRPGNPVKLSLIDEDEPRHGQLRGLVNRGFTPRMVAKLEEVFRQLTREAIDAVAHKGECDFVEDIAVPLPLLLIAELIGIEKADRHRFHQWSDALIAGDGNLGNEKIAAAAGKAFNEYAEYLGGIFADRRAAPRDDLVSILVSAQDDGLLGKTEYREGATRPIEGTELANDELVMFMILLLVAGNETTRNGLSGGVQLLIENPEERSKLEADPSLVPSAVEEMLRMVSPVLSFARTATEDTEIRGQRIAEGQKVLVVYPSANRDAEVFEDPDRFDVERNPNHLAFGVGNHFCLGANLARMEMRVAVSEILRRLPDMEYSTDGPEYRPSSLVRSCTHMYVRFRPQGVEEG